MKLSVNEVRLINRMSGRVVRGKVTTHKDWFESACDELELDFVHTMSKLLNNKLVTRCSKSNLFPVSIMIYRD